MFVKVFMDTHLLWASIFFDIIAAVCYVSTSISIYALVRRKRVGALIGAFPFLTLSAFTLACGITRIVEVIDLWYNVLIAETVTKAVAAGLALVASLIFFKLATADDALSEMRYAMHQRLENDDDLKALHEFLSRK